MCDSGNQRPFWQGREFSYFRHEDCEYFPCHATGHPEEFNCLFCYCPLYVLGDRCGGEFTYLDNGYKDCSRCLFPHEKENYGQIIDRFPEVVQVMQSQRDLASVQTERDEEHEN